MHPKKAAFFLAGAMLVAVLGEYFTAGTMKTSTKLVGTLGAGLLGYALREQYRSLVKPS